MTLADGTVLNDSIPVTIQPGVAVDINQKLATMTTTLADQKGDINTIRSTANGNSARISNHDGRLNTVEQGGQWQQINHLDPQRKGEYGRTDGKKHLAEGAGDREEAEESAERWQRNRTIRKKILCRGKLSIHNGAGQDLHRDGLLVDRVSQQPGNNIKAYVVGVNNDWTYCYSSGDFKNTSRSVVRFKFEAKATKQMIVRFYEQSSSDKDPGSYNGVHIDWVRVDEGDWTGTGDNGKTLDAWTPSEAETDAVNLLPDPGFLRGYRVQRRYG